MAAGDLAFVPSSCPSRFIDKLAGHFKMGRKHRSSAQVDEQVLTQALDIGDGLASKRSEGGDFGRRSFADIAGGGNDARRAHVDPPDPLSFDRSHKALAQTFYFGKFGHDSASMHEK